MGRFLIATVCFLTGCAGEPFTRPPRPVLKDPKPQAVREGFEGRLPGEMRTQDELVIRFPFVDDFALLDRVDFDRGKGTFRAIGLTHFGVLAFDVAGDKSTLTINSVRAQLEDHRDLVLSIARDFERTYLDLSPDAAAKSTVRPTEVLFTQKTAEGTLTFEYAYDPPVLIEKRLNGFWGTIWRVQYFDYRAGAEGKIHPRGIVFDNSQRHYRIIVRAPDIQSDQIAGGP